MDSQRFAQTGQGEDIRSSNNWSGFFGFEIENTTRFEAKNVYVRKLN
jgi:hypothetical protein